MTYSTSFAAVDLSELEYDDTLIATETDMLTDPSATLLALQRLRVLKTRETGDDVVDPDTSGRRRVEQINFDNTSYEQYKMRRKAQVLSYSGTSTENKKTQFSSLSRLRKGVNNARLQSLQESKVCDEESVKTKIKKGTNSGIRGDGTLLFFDNSVKYIEKL